MDFELYKHAVAAQFYADNGKLKDAFKEIKYCLSKDERNAEFHMILGSLYGMQKKSKKAITEFLEALTLNPNIDAHAVLGAAYLNIGQIDQAVTELTKVTVNDLNNFKVHNLLGVCFYRQKRFDDASRELILALKINPNTPDVHGFLSKIYKKQGQHERARQELEIEKKIQKKIK
jgi:Flp pilus assembly protein TadD